MVSILELKNFVKFIEVERKVRYSIQTLGLIGNTLMFIVYCQKSFRKLSLSTYLRSVAFFCACQNIAFFLFYFEVHYNLINKFSALCKLMNYVWIIFGPLSAWFEVVCSLDRFITILFPVKGRFIIKPIFKRLITIILILYNLCFYLVVLIDYDLLGYEETDVKCFNKNLYLLEIMDFINGVLLPFILMVILSISTTVGVLKAHKRVRNNRSANRTLTRDIKFGITMIILNIFFFILNMLPKLIFIYNFNPFDEENNFLARNIFNSIFINDLYEFYFSIIFFVQLAVNNLVRKELLNIFRRFLSFFKRN